MHIQHLVAVSSLLLLGNVGHSLARLDESNVPSQCKDVCEPVVQASQKCDRDVHDRKTRMDCNCTWIRLKTSGTVSNCNRCMHQRHGGDWDKRDDYDSDDSDSSDDDSDDEDDMYQSCRATATASPTAPTMAMSSTTSTMATQPSASTMGSESSETVGSSSSSTASGSTSTSSSAVDNGAVSLPMSASLAAFAGLAIFSWL